MAKVNRNVLTGFMQPSAHEVPSKTSDVHFGGTDMTIDRGMSAFGGWSQAVDATRYADARDGVDGRWVEDMFEGSTRWPRRSCGTAGGARSQFNRVALVATIAHEVRQPLTAIAANGRAALRVSNFTNDQRQVALEAAKRRYGMLSRIAIAWPESAIAAGEVRTQANAILRTVYHSPHLFLTGSCNRLSVLQRRKYDKFK